MPGAIPTKYYAWRTMKGEEMALKPGSEFPKCNWYESIDKPGQRIYTYAVEKTNIYENTGIRFDDRFLNTTTENGEKCSGEIGKWIASANM